MASIQPSRGSDQLVFRLVRGWWTGLPEADKTILTGSVLLMAPFLLTMFVLLLRLQ